MGRKQGEGQERGEQRGGQRGRCMMVCSRLTLAPEARPVHEWRVQHSVMEGGGEHGV